MKPGIYVGMPFGNLEQAQKHQQQHAIINGHTVIKKECDDRVIFSECKSSNKADSVSNLIIYTDNRVEYLSQGELWYSGNKEAFDSIDGTSQYARDLNGNGVVDQGEIFNYDI